MGAWRNTQFLGPNGTEVNADLLSLVSSCVRSGSFDYEQLSGSWEALKKKNCRWVTSRFSDSKVGVFSFGMSNFLGLSLRLGA